MFAVTSGQPYYLVGLYPALLGAGGIHIERRWSTRGARRYVVVAVVVIRALAAPIALPILPNTAVGDGPIAELSEAQRESDAWPAFARAVDAGAEPGDVAFTGNYGEAGAVERFAGYASPTVFRNAEDVANEQNGVEIARCEGPRRRWSVERPSLRHYDA